MNRNVAELKKTEIFAPGSQAQSVMRFVIVIVIAAVLLSASICAAVHAFAAAAPSAPAGAFADPLAANPEIGFAEYSDEEDFIKAGGDKVLLRWDGQFAGARITLGDRLSGGVLSRAASVKLADLVSNRRSPNKVLADAAQNFGSRTLAGWVCTPTAAFLFLAPASAAGADALEYVSLTASQLLGFQGAEGIQLLGCSLERGGQLFVAFDQQGDTNLRVALPLTDRPSIRSLPQSDLHHLKHFNGSASPSAVAVFRARLPQQSVGVASNAASQFWAVVASSFGHAGKPLFELTIYDDNLGFVKSMQVLHPFNGLDDQALIKMRIVARDNQILAAAEGSVALSRISPDFETASSVRLPIAPCSDTQTCGLSLGRDGSWLVVGYWGSYHGLGENFRTASLRSFSSESATVTVAHTRIPGEAAVFGSDDASFEKIADPVVLGLIRSRLAPLTAQSPIFSSAGRAKPSVAWLKPGVAPLPAEETLFDLPQRRAVPEYSDGMRAQPLKVVLTHGRFDPKRHLAFEMPVRFGFYDDPVSQNHAGLTTDGLWFKEFLRYQAVQERLDASGVKLAPMTVTLLDSGADLSHPDFHPAPDAFPALVQSPSSVAYDIGYDFVDEDAQPQDQFGHGTHVCGLAKPAMPMFGHIALVIARVLDANGKSNSIDIGRGFIYAAKRRSDLINASWGGGARTQFMQDAIEYAQSQGALVVTSAGNDKLNIDRAPPVPSNFAGVLSIGAISSSGRRAPFSNFGKETVFGFVPGDEIESFAIGGGYTLKSGTSMAAPLFVSSAAVVAGLLKTQRPDGTSSQWQDDLKRAFCPSALNSDEPAPNAGDFAFFSDPLRARSRCGALNLEAAVEAVLAP